MERSDDGRWRDGQPGGDSSGMNHCRELLEGWMASRVIDKEGSIDVRNREVAIKASPSRRACSDCEGTDR